MIEPARSIAQGGNQRQARPALRCSLGRRQKPLGQNEIAGWVGDIDHLQRAPEVEERLERKCSVQSLVPGGDASGEDAAHGQPPVKTMRVLLYESGSVDAASV